MSKNGKKERAEFDIGNLPALPRSWCWTTVDQVGEVRLGRQRSPKNRSDQFPTKYLRAGNITWRGLSLDDVMDMDFKPSERTIYALQPGDILLSEASGSADEVGKPAIWDGEIADCCFQNTVIRFRPRNLPPDFPFVVFCHFARNKLFAHVAKGIGIHHLGADRFGQMPFPMPPAAEQVRVKAKVDELFSDLDAGVAALERVRVNLKRYRAAVLKAAVEGRLTAEWRAKNPSKESGPQLLARILTERRRKWESDQLAAFARAGRTLSAKWKEKYNEPAGPDCTNLPMLPEGWCWATVDQLIFYLRNGLSLKPSQTPPGHRILRINAVRPMAVNLQEIRYYAKPDAQVADFFIENGDLLFTRYNGSVDLLGVAGMVRACSEPTLHPDKLIRVKTVLGHPLPAYLEIAANIGVSRQHMQSRARTTAGQTGISGVDIREMPVPLCSVPEQEQILEAIDRRLSALREVDAEVEASLKRSARLQRSILKRAFEGKLVAQDPHDESASALLAGISTQAKDGRVQLEEPRRSRSSRKRTQAKEVLSCRKSS